LTVTNGWGGKQQRQTPNGAASARCRTPSGNTRYSVWLLGQRAEAAPLGVCRCCLPPQPLVTVKEGGTGTLVCRNKPQQHYAAQGGVVQWLGLAPAVDQAAVTAAVDAALHANNAELTLFGLFAPPAGRG
jgi:hypothetical protein